MLLIHFCYFSESVFVDIKKDHPKLLKINNENHEVHSKGKDVKVFGRKQWLSKAMCEPNFSCPFCDAAFVRVDSMQSHLRQHQKLQPELETEIFALQQQLLQKQQCINQPAVMRTLCKRTTEKINSNVKSSDVIRSITPTSKLPYNQQTQDDQYVRKIINVNNSIPLINKSVIANPEESATTSSLTLSSASVASSPTNSETDISHERAEAPITLIMSPQKAGKSLLPTTVHDIQSTTSPAGNLQGLSYIAVSPTTAGTSTTIEQNVTTLSIPVTTENKNAGDGITLIPNSVSLRNLPYIQELPQRSTILGKVYCGKILVRLS